MSFEKVNRLTDAQIRDLDRLFQNEWWTKGRSVESIRIMLENSDFIFGLCETSTGRLVAFARVLTDRVFKALIFDVIVSLSHRERGLGRVLIEDILRHPALEGVRHFELYCLPEMAPFYEPWGFKIDVGGVHLMRRQATRVS